MGFCWVVFSAAAAAVCASGVDANNDFDFLMFTQLWPVTSCLEWKDKDEAHNTCTIDGDQNHWTIHGIWPTRKHQVGPLFCNESARFDPDALEPLMPELIDKWTDVRNTDDKYNFWRHEWLKHGTCAMQLPSMDTEVKYFNKALELHRKYNVFELLKSAGIEPGGVMDPVKALKMLKEGLSGEDHRLVNPAINCAHDHQYHDPLFYEVIVCLDKEFNRIDCDETKGGLYGSCRRKDSLVVYPTLGPSRKYSITVGVLVTVFFLALLAPFYLFVKALVDRYQRRTEYARLNL